MANSSKIIVLSSQDNWDDWIFVVKSMATGRRNVWKYINPDLQNPPELPIIPENPLVSEVKRGANSIQDLDQKKLEHYKFLYTQTQNQASDIARILDQIQLIREWILNHTTPAILKYIRNECEVHGMLKGLAKR
ncbi:hypothetical protein HI914_03437 [Erysiphe necator]|nr:hypothetical protein HI914_03437 [Erysiphe necator]